jgi:hypothetical protein
MRLVIGEKTDLLYFLLLAYSVNKNLEDVTAAQKYGFMILNCSVNS